MASKKNLQKDEATLDAKAGGVAAGGTAGAVIGGMVGGPVGAGVGAVAGAAAGGAAGAALDYDEVEPEFRSHYESGPNKSISTWEEVAPAYRYGFENAGSETYRGKSFDDVKADLKKGWRHKGRFDDVEPMVRTGWERHARARLDSGGEAVIPVVEEEVKVGKRKVEKGGVRVESKVVETPVEEQVHLHEEHVKVQRRPASRKATAEDAACALQEGTLELTETAEEAVVSKTARVIEEVVISKEGRDRTETVRDKVRRTDVDVEKTGGRARTAATRFEDLDFRDDYRTRFGSGGYTYEQVMPAYRFGYDLAGDDRYNSDWATVEPEARRRWEERNAGTWEQFKDSVRHAWERVTGRR